MDGQPKDQRIKQLKMWEKHSKEGLDFLRPIKSLLEGFKENHPMHVHHLSDTISELDRAIKDQEDLYLTSGTELEDFKNAKV